MRTWLPIVLTMALIMALIMAPALFAADLPPGFRMTPGYEEVPSNHAYVQFDTRTIEDLGAGGKLQSKKLEGRMWVMDIRRTGSQKPGDAQMADHEASLKSDGWTIIRDHGELEAKKRAGAKAMFTARTSSGTAELFFSRRCQTCTSRSKTSCQRAIKQW